MNISPVSAVNTTPSFGQIKLGRGGTKRLVESMPSMDARIMIGRNFFTKSDILITEKSIEVITPERDRIYTISDIIASGNGYTDIEVFEHGMRNVFRVNQSIINTYGAGNKQICLAEAIAKEIDRNYNWKENVRIDDTKENVSENTQKLIDDLNKYYTNYGMF